MYPIFLGLLCLIFAVGCGKTQGPKRHYIISDESTESVRTSEKTNTSG